MRVAFVSLFHGRTIFASSRFVRAWRVTHGFSLDITDCALAGAGMRCLTAKISYSARARRRSEEAARVEAHRMVAKAPRTDTVLFYVSVPREHRDRAGLTHRVSRAKVFVPSLNLHSERLLRAQLRDGMAHLFPELKTRGLLSCDPYDVEITIGNNKIAHEDDLALSTALARFRNEDGTLHNVFAEIHLKLIPPPLPPLSPRRQSVREKSAMALAEASPLRMVSFYKLTAVENPQYVCGRLTKFWGELGVLGRVYIATEGFNAQLAVPVPLWNDFCDAMSGSWIEREKPIVPEEVIGVFLNRDSDVSRDALPFEKLHVRVREKVLADGLDRPLDWNHAGREVSPAEWHDVLMSMSRNHDASNNPSSSEQSQAPDSGFSEKPKHFPIILDCRNDYESNVGKFEGSEPLGTKTFRESWDVLQRRLADVPRDQPIMTFCTGGIRCNKINAYLEQEMGFKDTGRLSGGIISYARMLREQDNLKDSCFKGVNHVFDGRVGESITDDILEQCINCGAPCNVQTDCANVHCSRSYEHRLFVQCPDCAVRLRGACSETCRDAAFPRMNDVNNRSKAAINCQENDRPFDVQYACEMSETESTLLRRVREETAEQFPNRAQMVCGPLEGALLQSLVGLTGATRALEIGTFTGYSALHIAKALPDAGMLVTCEQDKQVAAIAESYFKLDKDHGHKIHLLLGNARDHLSNMLSCGERPFDLIFLDADKDYQAYYELLMGRLLRVGGLLVVDNVLYKGQVAQIRTEQAQNAVDDREAGQAIARTIDPTLGASDDLLARRRLKSLENVRKVARKIDSFNQSVAADPRVEVVMLPVRDGISLIRRKS